MELKKTIIQAFYKKISFKINFILLLLFTITIKYKRKYNSLFFEKENLNYCKQYGLLVYDYHYSLKSPYKTLNIGDYIQSLSALQYLPKECIPILINRDTIQYYHGPKVKLIVNGRYFLQEGNIITSEQIEPLYLSYHIQNNRSDMRMIRHLKKYEPIGCRDIFTYNLLKKNGITTYFSSCLTTTLDILYYKKESFRTQEIIFTDFKFGYLNQADIFIKNLSKYNFSNITYIKHDFSTKINHFERFQIADRILKKYATAKLVITTRIHAALPCLSLRTPVILVNKKYDKFRFEGLYDLLNTIGMNSNQKFEINVNVNKSGYIYNSEKYLIYSKKLKKIIEDKFKRNLL